MEKQNNAGGSVFKVGDMMQLQRFVIMGTEGGTFYVEESDLKRENIKCIDRLIGAGHGKQAVKVIKEISVNRRNFRQNSLLLALAICARSNDKDTKKAAYAALSDICRIPTFLFKFIQFCEEESHHQKGTGWGRAHKRAISKWYTDFQKHPEKLARHVTKYKNREGWTHKDILRLAHTSCNNKPIGFIIRYIIKGYGKAHEMYLNGQNTNEEEMRILNMLDDLLLKFDRAVLCKTSQELCGLIRELQLSWELCPTKLLKCAEVWKELLIYMPIEATIRNLGRMTSIGLFASNSKDESLVLEKIGSINTIKGVQEVGDTEEEYRIGNDYLHPFKILLAYATYKNGKGDKGKLTWTPNEQILKALNEAFYQAFQYVLPTNQKYFLAVDVSGSMTQPVLGCNNLHCNEAAAAMMMVTVRTEPVQNFHIKGFGNTLVDLDISREDTLEVVMKKTREVNMGATDCALPMMYAKEKEIYDIDVFVVYTDNETWYGKVHPSEALKEYRNVAVNKAAKLIVCGMCATEFTIADPEDRNMLDIVGFDSAAPRLIAEFAKGNLVQAFDEMKII